MPVDRIAPLDAPKRIAPLASSFRIAPLPPGPTLYVYPGSSKFCRLAETCRPFSDCYIFLEGTATLSALAFRKNAEAFAGVTLGSYPDLISAARYITFAAVAFGTTTYDIRATDSAGVIVTSRTTVHTDVRIGDWRMGPGYIPAKNALINQKTRPFADSEFSLPGATENTYIASCSYTIDGGAPVTIGATPDGRFKEIKKLALSWGTAVMRTLLLSITDTSAGTATASVKIFVG